MIAKTTTNRIRLAALLAGAGVAALALPSIAYAQTEQVKSFDVPAQSLAQAAAKLSEQADVQLILDSTIGNGLTSGSVTGRMSVNDAMGRLLAGTGLTWRSIGNGTITIERPVEAIDGERVLGAVRVEGTQGGSYTTPIRGDGVAQLGGIRGGQDEEAVGYRAKVASVSTGAPVALEDIPRSITVQTQEQIEKQDITTLEKALDRLPGVSVVNLASPTEGPSIFVRDVALTKFTVDGGASRDLASLGQDGFNLDAYERVELVRGPNALSVGEGSPGGSINLVRKRPSSTPMQSIILEGGSFGKIAAVVDVSTPSFLGSGIAFRGVASVRREDSFIDDLSSSSRNLYGIFDIPFGENARLEAGFNLNRSNAEGSYDGALRSVEGDLADLPVSYNLGGAGHSAAASNEIFTKLYVDLADSWDLEFGAAYTDRKSRLVRSSAAVVFRSGGEFIYPGQVAIIDYGTSTPSQLETSAKLTGSFDTFGIKHDVLLGLSKNSEDSGPRRVDNALSSSVGYTFEELRTAEQVPYFPSESEILYGNATTSSTSIVISDTLSWRDVFSFTGTFRRDGSERYSADVKKDYGRVSNISISAPPTKPTWRPSFSAFIKPAKEVTVFGSYADGFFRQDTLFSRSGTAPNFAYSTLLPYEFQNKEVGVKFASKKVGASISGYDLIRKGIGVWDGSPGACPPVLGTGNLSLCYLAEGSSVKSQGVDFEINGEIMDGLHVVANFNYNKSKNLLPTTGRPVNSDVETLAPMSSGGVFVDWRPAFLPGAALQIGARYKSAYFASGSRELFDANGGSLGRFDYEVSEKGYLVGDLGLDYDFSDGLSLRLFVENIFDRQYLSTPSTNIIGSFYGKPRSFLASLKWKGIGKAEENSLTHFAPFGRAEDWYAGFDVGFQFSKAISAVADGSAQDGISPVQWKFDLKGAPVYAARIGYKIADSVRVELEGQYKTAALKTVGGNVAAPYAVCGVPEGAAPFDCDNVPGKLDNWALAANLIYDFGSNDAIFKPFLGVGLGFSRNSMSFQGKMDGIGLDAPWTQVFCEEPYGCFPSTDRSRMAQELIASSDTTTSFMWQAMAGASFKITDRLNIEARFKHSEIPNITWSSYNLDTAAALGPTSFPLTPRLGAFKGKSASNVLTIGLRWKFGASN